MMMFDFNPWTSLFLLQALRLDKRPCDARARRREQIADLNKQLGTSADAPVVRPAKLPPPPARQKTRAPRRGWRYTFRTDAARTEASATAGAESRDAA
jgi:hypothetical protein